MSNLHFFLFKMSSNTPPGSPNSPKSPMDKNDKRDVRRSVNFSSNRAMFERNFPILDFRTFKPTRTSLTDDDKTKMKESGFIASTSSSIPAPPPPPQTLTNNAILEPNPDYSPEISSETPPLKSDPSSHDLKPSGVLADFNNDQAIIGHSSKAIPSKPPRRNPPPVPPRETFAQTVKRAIFMPWTIKPPPVPKGK